MASRVPHLKEEAVLALQDVAEMVRVASMAKEQVCAMGE
jgi:hypothetical protein